VESPDSSLATLDDVIITSELLTRPTRTPDFAAENRALCALATAMSQSPETVFQELVDAARDLCGAGSAGISIRDADDGSDVFRWRATSGEYAQYLGATLPRAFSPCGTVLDRDAAVLMSDPVRFFPYIEKLSTPVCELLLIPFYDGATAVGTVWIVAHDAERRFDAEDARVMTSLTKFAAASVSMLARIQASQEAEGTVREARTRIESTLIAGEVGTWVYDIVENKVVADRNLARMFGMSDAEAAGGALDSYLRAIHPEDRSRVVESINQALAVGSSFESEYRLLTPEHEVSWVVARGTVERDESGRAVQLPGVVVDITDRKRSDAERRASEERFSTLFSSMDEGFCVIEMMFDDAGKPFDYSFLEINPAFIQQTGLADAVGRTMRDFAPAHEEYWFETYGRVAMTGEPIRFESEAKALGRWFDVYAFRFGETESCRVAVLFKDITQRKQAEVELRNAEEQRRMALDAGELGAWNINLTTNVFAADDRFRLIFQGSSAPLTYEAAIERIHPEDREQVIAAVAAATRAEDPAPYASEYRVVHPDGKLHWVFARGRASYAGEGADRKLTSFDGTVVDITERKAMEDELRRVAADMSEADHRKDEFLAMLAHELRNPLAPLRNALEIVRLSADDPQSVRSAAALMDRQVHHMVRLVDDLLDVSRITRGKIDLRLERVDLESIIRQAVETSRPSIEAARHKLTMTLPLHAVWLRADAVRLAQVFANLLNNSCKYSEPDGRITLAAEAAGDEVVVSVRDTGVGIPAEMLPKIFELFMQIDQSLERSQGGLGIGLSLVRSLVELHGGSVQAFSEGPGLGSEFIVRLPILKELPKQAAQPTADGSGKAKGRKILVVDDNRDSAMSLAMLLKLMGNTTQTAFDGVEAFAAAQAFQPDVVLLDIGLPLLNGYEVAAKIREQRWGAAIVLVALTGWGQEEDRKRSQSAGFDAHMVKPVEIAALTKLLAEHPNRRA